MTLIKGGRTAKVVLSLLFLLSALSWWLNSLLLVVSDAASKGCFTYPCSRGDTFQIRLIHSVEKTPWEDTFAIRGSGDLLLTTSKFESLGWGYPYSPSDGKFSIDKDKKFLLTMNRPFPKINTCISIQAMPKFIYGPEVLNLCREFGDGAFVEIRVEKRYKFFLKQLTQRR